MVMARRSIVLTAWSLSVLAGLRFASPVAAEPRQSLSQIDSLGATPKGKPAADAPKAETPKGETPNAEAPNTEKAVASPTPGEGGWAALPSAYDFAVLTSGIERGVQFGREPLDNGRVFIATAGGKIVEMDAAPSGERATVLDIKERLVNDHEGGILGFAFDPNFEKTRRVFVHYLGKRSSSPLNRLSSFVLDSKVGTLNADTEEVLMDLPQPELDHAGGQVMFGPDGYLYYGMGDGGGRSDPKRRGQSPNDLYGAILRLDISEKPPIPPLDNPFVSNRNGAKELWALGLRNPTSFAFDPASKELWAADSGLGDYQEINLIQPGANYGWSVLDGTVCLALRFECMNQKYVGPVFAYPTKTGATLVLGPIYQGLEHEELRGKLIFLDKIQGTLWAMKRNEPPQVILQTKRAIATIGVNIDGELLFADADRGEILKLRKAQ